MEVRQIYALVNDLKKEGVGAQNITVKSIDNLISYGESVLSSGENQDAFYKKLTDRFGRTWFKYKRYFADNKDSILRTPMEFGIIMQKVQVKNVGKMVENTSYKNQSNPFSQAKDTTSIEQTLFKAFSTFQTETKVIYRSQLNSAFTSPTAFASFVDMIYNDMYNAMEKAVEDLIKLIKCAMIGNTLTNGTLGKQARNVFMEYITKNPTSTITEENCLTDVDFLKYLSRELALITKRFPKMSQCFNTEGADRWTDRENMEIEVLADLATATASYLEADTYHRELIALPRYREISSVQSDSDFSFNEVSKIDISLGEEGTDDYIEMTATGIIAYVYDRDACAVMLERPRVCSMFNELYEMNNVNYKMDWAGAVDKSENCCVLFIKDTRDEEPAEESDGK